MIQCTNSKGKKVFSQFTYELRDLFYKIQRQQIQNRHVPGIVVQLVNVSARVSCQSPDKMCHHFAC